MTGSSSSSSRPRAGAVALAALAGALAMLLASLAAGESLRRNLFDAWQRTAPREIAAREVAVVLIDPESLAAFGGWPWPRYYLARLTETIAAARPRAIGFDIIFPESDRHNPDAFAALYPELGEADAARVAALPSMDSLFAATVGQAPVVLGRLGIEADGSDPAGLALEPEISGKPPAGTLAFGQVLASIPELDDVALAHGMVNGPTDADGIVRSVPLAVRAGGRAMPGFAVELARLAAGERAMRWDGGRLLLGKHALPAGKDGRLLLRFGDFPAAATYSAARVLAGTVPSEAFAGKAVLVGLGAEGTSDIVATPVTPQGYGLFVQAQAVDAMLHRGWLERPPAVAAAEWLAAALLAALAGLAGMRWRPALVLGALAAFGLPLASWLLFDRANLLFDPVRPLMLGGGAAAGVLLHAFARARAERKRLAAALVEQRVASARQEGELEAARAIQLGMVPGHDKLAALDPRVDIAGVLDPARSVGGDFYDAARLDDGRLLLVIGDVTGKGVPAALYMALSKGLARTMLTRGRGGLGGGISELNRQLLAEADEAMGVTMLVALLDPGSGAVTMVNAGHENPLLRAAGGAARSLPMRGGPPLCVVDFPYAEEAAELAPGDTLVLVTDGVTEAEDAERRLFGVERAIAAIEAAQADARALVAHLAAAVRDFEGATEPSDDLTVLAARWRGPQEL